MRRWPDRRLLLHLFAVVLVACSANCARPPVPVAPKPTAPPEPALTSKPIEQAEPGTAARRDPPPPPAQREPTPQPPRPELVQSLPRLADQLSAALQSKLQGDLERMSFVVEHAASGTRLEHAADRRFVAASVYKLGLAYEVLRQVDSGALSLDDRLVISAADTIEDDDGGLPIGGSLTVREALESALGPSNNAAAFALLRLVGRAQLNESLARLALGQTTVPLLVGEVALPGSPTLDPEHAVTSAADMAHLLNLLATDQLLGADSTQFLRDLLALEDPWNPVTETLASDGAVLFKSGTLPGVWNVAGTLATSRGWVTLVVLSEDADRDAMEAAIAAIVRAISDVFSRP